MNDEVLAAQIEAGLTYSQIQKVTPGMSPTWLYENLKRICSERGLEMKKAYSRRVSSTEDRMTSAFIQNDIKSEIRLQIPDGMVVIASDCHYADIDHLPVAHMALCNLLAEYKQQVKAVILNGDLTDMGAISRHGPNRWIKPRSVYEELEAVKKRTEEIEAQVVKQVPKIRLWGNHDERFEIRLATVAQEFRDVHGFRLKDHLPLWDEAWVCQINEDFFALHSWHNGRHAGYNNVVHGMAHVATGHTHHLLCRHKAGFKDTYYGIETGMIADPDQAEFNYRKGTPSDWHPGFAVLTWENGRLLFPEFCAVIDDKAHFRGRRFA